MTIAIPTQRNRAAAPALTDLELVERIARTEASQLQARRADAICRQRQHAARREHTSALDATREVAEIEAALVRALEVAADPGAELRRRERAAVRVLLGGVP